MREDGKSPLSEKWLPDPSPRWGHDFPQCLQLSVFAVLSLSLLGSELSS